MIPTPPLEPADASGLGAFESSGAILDVHVLVVQDKCCFLVLIRASPPKTVLLIAASSLAPRTQSSRESVTAAQMSAKLIAFALKLFDPKIYLGEFCFLGFG